MIHRTQLKSVLVGKYAHKQIARGYDIKFILLLVSPYRLNHFKNRGNKIIFRIFCCSLWEVNCDYHLDLWFSTQSNNLRNK
jgi:hypothetical protein